MMAAIRGRMGPPFMNTTDLLDSIQLGIRRYGPMGWLRDAYWRHQFAHARQAHLFLGVYQSHEAAMAAAPPTAPLSYDNSASARLYLDRMEVDDYDYPALHWIGDGLRRGLRSLVDVGGSVGIKFYAFRRMLDYPAELRWLVGSSIGPLAASVPLSCAAIPYFARLVEQSLREVPRGVIEAAHAMGASELQIIFRVLLVEARSGLVQALVVLSISFLSYTAIAGVVGGGGVGDLAIRYGYQRFQTDVMLLTVAILVVMVQLIQMIGNHVSRRLDKR